VPVAGRLLQSELTSQEIFNEIKTEYAELRTAHAARQQEKNYLSIDQARAKSSGIDWTGFKSKQPSFLGVKYFEDYSLEEIA
jgi:5-methyltetrahydrofolate--homocysteine methyltransferase